ncbi:hypothetical protein CDD83_1579 [Cordyceps sp. RAO-2017]|nr:hypothetical protein CDD83_1579 [Cordyceps sp. RAO-2017]
MAYSLAASYTGASFLSAFNWFDGVDPSNGFVAYQGRSGALAKGLFSVDEGTGVVRLGVDHKHTYRPDEGRPSIRLESKDTFDHGLFIADFLHMPPSQCGLWPAFWLYGSDWPSGGEIDIIEGVNTIHQNTITAHTVDGCKLSSVPGGADAVFTGELSETNCAVGSKNVGCGYRSPANVTTSYGDGFNAVNGGVYAMLWDAQHVKVWHFERGKIPKDVEDKAPNPESWKHPVAVFGGRGCDVDSFFKNMKLVLNINFCGDWAGAAWGRSDGCDAFAPTCSEYVARSPEAFANAYWDVRYINAYQRSGKKMKKEETVDPRPPYQRSEKEKKEKTADSRPPYQRSEKKEKKKEKTADSAPPQRTPPTHRAYRAYQAYQAYQALNSTNTAWRNSTAVNGTTMKNATATGSAMNDTMTNSMARKGNGTMTNSMARKGNGTMTSSMARKGNGTMTNGTTMKNATMNSMGMKGNGTAATNATATMVNFGSLSSGIVSSSAGNSSNSSATEPSANPTKVGKYAYLGCFGSRTGFQTFKQAKESSSMTIEMCVDLCDGKTFAGMFEAKCLCAESLDADTRAMSPQEAAVCDHPCPGDEDEFCGGLRDKSVGVGMNSSTTAEQPRFANVTHMHFARAPTRRAVRRDLPDAYLLTMYGAVGDSVPPPPPPMAPGANATGNTTRPLLMTASSMFGTMSPLRPARVPADKLRAGDRPAAGRPAEPTDGSMAKAEPPASAATEEPPTAARMTPARAAKVGSNGVAPVSTVTIHDHGPTVTVLEECSCKKGQVGETMSQPTPLLGPAPATAVPGMAPAAAAAVAVAARPDADRPNAVGPAYPELAEEAPPLLPGQSPGGSRRPAMSEDQMVGGGSSRQPGGFPPGGLERTEEDSASAANFRSPADVSESADSDSRQDATSPAQISQAADSDSRQDATGPADISQATDSDSRQDATGSAYISQAADSDSRQDATGPADISQAWYSDSPQDVTGPEDVQSSGAYFPSEGPETREDPTATGSLDGAESPGEAEIPEGPLSPGKAGSAESPESAGEPEIIGGSPSPGQAGEAGSPENPSSPGSPHESGMSPGATTDTAAYPSEHPASPADTGDGSPSGPGDSAADAPVMVAAAAGTWGEMRLAATLEAAVLAMAMGLL